MNIKEEVIIKELKEEYFKRTGRKIEEYRYCTIASEIKKIEPEYLEHEELYKKLDYLHSIIINNIGQHLIKKKETYDTEIVDIIRRINLTIKYQEQAYSPYYQAQPEKEKQECLQNSYIKFLEELYEKQVGIWIANQYLIAEIYEELEKYHEQYWE
ncbi:hypothetical protein C2G38_2231127 [Gigaspora rosea]|uniref:Uncharacterized protein n=1 Tax=Gigaspora rosea TaxID=44941 RepID=A0A397TT87_9GLOM|nr:hypothetical protein C2G38_2231127 [Gigaspora rosea]